MKKFKTLSIGDKVFVVTVLLLMLIAAIVAIVAVIYSPLWKVSVLNGVCATFTLVGTLGVIFWFFIVMLIDMVFNK